mmetsp:Transcript_34807/g.59813  ORF Transcript_34807/g.59813 Transcript_34807/m.59813 type:complete len:378 (-) Transcript_34807:332-1465(-)
MDGRLRMATGAALGVAATCLFAAVLDRCLKHTRDMPGGSKGAKQLKDAPLSEALTPEMEEAALLAWRKKYRSYRQGEDRGAEGEATGLLKRKPSSMSALCDLAQHSSENDKHEVIIPDEMEPELENETFAFFDDRKGSWESLERASTKEPHSALTTYRLAYRAHRMGGSRGAKGELSDLPATTMSPRRRVRRQIAEADAEAEVGAEAEPHVPDHTHAEEARLRAVIAADPSDVDANYMLGALVSRKALRLERRGGSPSEVAALYDECAWLWSVSQGEAKGSVPAVESARAKAQRARQGKRLPTSDCLLNHGLSHGSANDGWSCDVCGNLLDEGMPASFCDVCEYVVCPRCKRKHAGGRRRGTGKSELAFTRRGGGGS